MSNQYCAEDLKTIADVLDALKWMNDDARIIGGVDIKVASEHGYLIGHVIFSEFGVLVADLTEFGVDID